MMPRPNSSELPRQLREMAEIGPERQRAADALQGDGDEESWAEYRRLKGLSND